MDKTEARQKALSFLQTHSAGVVATAGHDNMPHASAVYFAADEKFNLYFLTKVDSRKYKAIQAHPQVAFTVSSLDIPQTLQIEGVASEVTSQEDKDAHVPLVMAVLEKADQMHLPIVKMDSDVALIWIQPKWIRWGDFTAEGIGNDLLFTEIPIE